MKTKSLTSTLFVGMFAATTGCVVEMHPADTSPAPSAMPPNASGAPASAPAAAQPVQVVSGPSGINPPVRNAQPTATVDTTSTSTTQANGAPTSASTGGASAALR